MTFKKSFGRFLNGVGVDKYLAESVSDSAIESSARFKELFGRYREVSAREYAARNRSVFYKTVADLLCNQLADEEKNRAELIDSAVEPRLQETRTEYFAQLKKLADSLTVVREAMDDCYRGKIDRLENQLRTAQVVIRQKDAELQEAKQARHRSWWQFGKRKPRGETT